MAAFIGIALLIAVLLVLRRLMVRPDRPQPGFIRHAGAASGVAVACTCALALAVGLIIHGGMGLWPDAVALWAASP